jgi:two-component system, sensor histidine kinase PdtaS
MTAAERFARLSTPAKLLLILTAVLLPIGVGLMVVAQSGIREATAALQAKSDEQAGIAARGIESLVARNVLALRIASSGRLDGPQPCERVQRSLSIAPAVARQFRLHSADGAELCSVGDLGETGELRLLAPGDIQLAISPGGDRLIVQAGVVGGMATTIISGAEMHAAASEAGRQIDDLVISDGVREIAVMTDAGQAPPGYRDSMTSWTLANGQLTVQIEGQVPAITMADRLAILLPVLMWFIAALMTWLMVHRLLIKPLRRLQLAVSEYEPGEPARELPTRLGPATEIQELRDAFARAMTRVQQSEGEMLSALEGQRRLVREVHHRVKNNLQVIASLLSIHGRTAQTPAASAAYGSIGRRVGALAIVHRHHYAEMEESRGLSLRPLLSELAAELRAGAPDTARELTIELEVEPLHTTQDVAVSTAFLITEVVEFAMLHRPDQPVEISVRRTSDLTARLTLGSPVLDPESAEDPEKVRFERIIAGLAKQLRSTLDRKLGRYSVDLPVFPAP